MRFRRLLVAFPLLFAATCAKVADGAAQAGAAPAPQAHPVNQTR